MGERSPGQALERALLRAGLVDDAGTPLIAFHGLRHTAASIVLGAGVPLIVVSRQLGHADPQITARVYAHLVNRAQLDEAASVFDRINGSNGTARTLRGTLREAAATH